MKNADVAVIIPVYNEGQVIGKVLGDVLKKFKYVVCVNDGSKDNSSSEINKTAAYLVEHPINLGQGAAIQTGIEFALTLPVDYFVTFDSDGQHRIIDVLAMLTEIRKQKTDIVFGSRFLGSAENIRPLKKAILKVAVKFSNITSGVTLTDTHNGLRVFNRVAAEGMKLQMSDFSHASEIIDRVAENNYRYTELPVTIIYSDYSMAKGQSMINAINIGFDLILGRIIGK